MNYHDDSSNTTTDSNSSCIRILPNELLAKIFSAVVNGWQDPRELPLPVLLSSVCCHWRMLARNAPGLWVNIVVPLHKSPEDCRRWTAEWIARSGILLISVMINDTMETRIVFHLYGIMELLSQYSERLRSLAIHSMHSALVESAFSRLLAAPNLQRLVVCADSRSVSWPQYEHINPRQYLLDFPKLTILKAQGLPVPPIFNLTSLTVRKLYGSYRTISHIFTASPGLKHLVLHELMPLADSASLSQAAIMRVDSLCSLAVNLRWSRPTPGQGSTYIFKYLSMPNLKYLELDGDAWRISDFGESLSAAKIDTLRISKRSEKSFDADTMDSLHSFSTVRHLQLIDVSTRGLFLKYAPGLTRKNSIYFRYCPSRPTPTNLDITTPTAVAQNQLISVGVWPELRLITLDTLTADGVLSLCNFVTSHQHVQIVELSPSAKRHLSSSLRRKNDSIYQRPTLFTAVGSEEGLNDVEEWLGKMVDIRALSSASVGLLDAD